MLKIIKKLQQGMKRLRLGPRFKHQYNCHPAFHLARGEHTCEVSWHGKSIATIPYASTLSETYQGPCFIVASGPSLADIDLHRLAAHDTICLNGAIKKFSASGLAPTHCVIVDHRVFERQWDAVVASVDSGAYCFFSFEGLSIIAERDPTLLQRGNIFLIESISRKFGVPRLTQEECLRAFANMPGVATDPALPQYCRAIGFSSNLEQGVFSGKTVATWAVQLAAGLGYRALFIVGMDLGGTGKAHFYADQHNPTPDFLRYYEPHIRACFEQARLACDKSGVKIYNLSLQSTLPDVIIPKIALESALQLASSNTTAQA